MHQFRILLCVTVCCTLAPLAHSAIQYKSQKIRGPPVPSRLTRNPQHLGTYTHQYQYTKSKRPQPQRNTGRPSNVRPIPVHMASYKVPVISRPPKTPAPLIFPSAVWKTPTAVYRPPVDNAKPFFVNPPLSHQHHQQLQHQQIQHQQNQQYQQHQQHQQRQQQQQQHQQHQQPQIQLQQFDYHINKEPMLNIPTIKQIGEKGPIHTIPAPNLSPADKPKLIYEEPAKQSYYQYTKQQESSPNSIQQSTITNSIAPAALIGAQALPLVSSLPLPQIPNYQVQQTHIPNYQLQQSQIQNYEIQQSQQQSAAQTHQYQVTENAEGADALQQQFNGQKTYFAPDPDTNFIQKLTQLTDTNSVANNVYSQDMFVSPHQFVSNAANSPLSAQDLYQLLNGVPQQQLVDSYGMPLMQQPQLQQHFIQQAAQNVPAQHYQYIQPQIDNAAYFNQIPDTVSQQIKDNFKPQFQTFNYEEPKKDFVQSRVTADYSIEPEAVDSSPKVVQQNPQEALAQTQYIQQYFQTREDTNVADNELESEHEGSTKASEILSQLSAKNEISPTMFYSSLPNKEAAEALANLQAAGSINTILKLNQNKKEQSTNQRDSMRIYVPDDEEAYDDLDTSGEGNKKNQDNNGFNIFETTHLKKDADNNRSGESSEYEDYSGEDNASSETSEQEASFGNKLKTKTTTR